MIETYWRIGQRIVEQEQNGKERAEYGTQLIEMLSQELTRTYGKGFSVRNLWLFKQFYLTFNDLEILHTRVQNLTWSHYRMALRVEDPVAARWYLQTASTEMWSVLPARTLPATRFCTIATFAAKYMPLMPTEEELRREIEQQKELYRLQQENK